MDLEQIKRGLRDEIKKRENEQYATFQCNVRQMCKDVLAKLEEQEAVIAELKDIESKNRSAYYKDLSMMAKDVEHQKFKRCLAMARVCEERYNYLNCLENYQMTDKEYQQVIGDYWDRWYKRWLELAEKFKEAK
ncbi:MAG: hypothetical protein II850_07515 [Fibrobacter sp.]|nr:hypothetical protein [Fibrobacter sp.]